VSKVAESQFVFLDSRRINQHLRRVDADDEDPGHAICCARPLFILVDLSAQPLQQLNHVMPSK